MALSYLIESFRGTDCGYCVPGTPFMGRSVLLASALLGSSLLQPAHGDSVQAEGFAAKAERGGKGDTRKISGMSANSSDLQGPVPATWRRLWRRTEAGRRRRLRNEVLNLFREGGESQMTKMDEKRKRSGWRSVRLSLLALLVVALAPVALWAGSGQWTSNGPYGGGCLAVAMDPSTPGILICGHRRRSLSER